MRIVHRQWQEFFDRLTGVRFLPTPVGDRLVAGAEVTDEAALSSLLSRGFEVHPDEPPPAKGKKPPP